MCARDVCQTRIRFDVIFSYATGLNGLWLKSQYYCFNCSSQNVPNTCIGAILNNRIFGFLRTGFFCLFIRKLLSITVGSIFEFSQLC